MKWTENNIAAFMARVTFSHKCLVVVPNCNWTGNECDILAVTNNLRVIDIEIKISRADLKADIKKDKWYHHWDWNIDGRFHDPALRRRRQWPQKVWKHYYVMPAEIWSDDLAEFLPRTSGVMLIHDSVTEKKCYLKAWRGARPQRDADKLTAEDAIDLARLASLRMWDAYDDMARMKADQKEIVKFARTA